MKKNAILLVDDNVHFTLRLTYLLSEMEGIGAINTAGSYEEALSMLDAGGYDLLLLDILLPGKTGIELLKKIKQTGWEGEVIMLSNFSGHRYEQECFKLGARYFLDKTNDIEKVPDIVNTLSAQIAGDP